MTFDFARYARYLLLNPSGDGWIVSEECPSELLSELKQISKDYKEIMGSVLLIIK